MTYTEIKDKITTLLADCLNAPISAFREILCDILDFIPQTKIVTISSDIVLTNADRNTLFSIEGGGLVNIEIAGGYDDYYEVYWRAMKDTEVTVSESSAGLIDVPNSDTVVPCPGSNGRIYKKPTLDSYIIDTTK